MEEDISKEVLIENTKEFVKDVYKDLAKPALNSIGNILSLPFKAIDAALTPIKKWIDKKNFNYQKTRELLAEKLQNVDTSKIVEPEAYVAVPALQQLSYSYDSEELRKMYANLLASSMIDDTKWNVHPSYVDIIRQMSPADAKAMDVIFAPDFLTIVTFMLKNKVTEECRDLVNHYCIELMDIYPNHVQQSSSLINLQRLGLIEIRYDILARPESKYDKFLQDDIYNQILALEKGKDWEIVMTKGLIKLTEFGINFCQMCCDKKVG